MPFGLSNDLGTFQWMMCHTFKDFLLNFLYVFMDGFCVYSTHEDNLEKLQLVLERYRFYKIALNPSKCHSMVSHGGVLGHIVSRREMVTNEDKSRVILNLEPHKWLNKCKTLWDTWTTTINSWKGVQNFLDPSMIWSITLGGHSHVK